ncbi:hypothetical protein [Streptomyces purpurascens]
MSTGAGARRQRPVLLPPVRRRRKRRRRQTGPGHPPHTVGQILHGLQRHRAVLRRRFPATACDSSSSVLRSWASA